MSLFQRISLAFAVLAGRTIPADDKELQMELAKVKAQVAELTSALDRAAANKAADAGTIAGLSAKLNEANASVEALTQQISAAEAQIVELLQPVVDQANGLAAGS
jgi:chromosome segregation ATPase